MICVWVLAKLKRDERKISFSFLSQRLRFRVCSRLKVTTAELGHDSRVGLSCTICIMILVQADFRHEVDVRSYSWILFYAFEPISSWKRNIRVLCSKLFCKMTVLRTCKVVQFCLKSFCDSHNCQQIWKTRKVFMREKLVNVDTIFDARENLIMTVPCCQR